MPPIKEIKGQPTWVDYGLPDLRTLERELRSSAVDEVEAADSHEAAIDLVAQYLGFVNPAILSLTIETPMGLVIVDRKSFYHIVEKRADARERYVKMAMDTLTGPFEVWKVEYDDGSYRLAFIGAYEAKRQMLVIVAVRDGLLFWNFMQTDAKSLNKHRHGDLQHQRYKPLITDKEKGQS